MLPVSKTENKTELNSNGHFHIPENAEKDTQYPFEDNGNGGTVGKKKRKNTQDNTKRKK